MNENINNEESKNPELEGNLLNKINNLNYADISHLILSELTKVNKYFKAKTILLTIIEKTVKIKSNSVQFDKIKSYFSGKFALLMRTLKKWEYIKKYNNYTWIILKPIEFANGIQIFSYSSKKQALLDILKRVKVITLSDLKQHKEIHQLNILYQINQINSLVPDLIIVRKNGNYLKLISFNLDLIKKYSDLI